MKRQQVKKTIRSTSRERRPYKAPAGKEDHMKHQQGKKTTRSTSRERRPYDFPSGKEDHVKHQQGKRPFRACFLSNFSSGSDFVQPSGTILAIFVKRHKRNISVKLFWNPDSGCRGDVLWKFFSIFSAKCNLPKDYALICTRYKM